MLVKDIEKLNNIEENINLSSIFSSLVSTVKSNRKYNFGREMTFSIQDAFIATSNTPLNIIIYLENSNVFGTTYCPHQDLCTNIYSIKTFVEQKHKKHKIT